MLKSSAFQPVRFRPAFASLDGTCLRAQLVQRETSLALLRCFGYVKCCGCAPALTNQDTRRLILDGSLCVLARTI
jgi:hypothetical protein